MLRSQWLRLVSVICVFALVGCSPDDKKTEAEDKNGGWIQVPFTVEIDEAKASQEQKELAQSINEKKGVKFERLTEIILSQHEKAWTEANKNESVDLKAEILAVMPKDTDDIKAIKPKYESALKKNSGEELVYNKDFVTAPSLVKDNRVQCYSGTIFFLSLTRLKGTLWSFGNNQVVILEPGHVLPGFMGKKEDQWQMTGVETTAGGKALIEYGAAAKLDEVPKPLRVIDSNYFLIIEALKTVLTNTDKVLLAALKDTAEAYAIPFKKTEAKVSQALAKSQSHVPNGPSQGDSKKSGKDLEQLMNASPLAFGQVSVPSGDQTRAEFDQKPVSQVEIGGAVIDQPNYSGPVPGVQRYECKDGEVYWDAELFVALFESLPMDQVEYLESCLTPGKTLKYSGAEYRSLSGAIRSYNRVKSLDIEYVLTKWGVYQANIIIGDGYFECYWPGADKDRIMNGPSPEEFGSKRGACRWMSLK